MLHLILNHQNFLFTQQQDKIVQIFGHEDFLYATRHKAPAERWTLEQIQDLLASIKQTENPTIIACIQIGYLIAESIKQEIPIGIFVKTGDIPPEDYEFVLYL